MRPFQPCQASFLLSLTIHSISAQLDLGTQLAYPTEFDITPILASTDGFISKEDYYASNTDNKECHSPDLQRRMRARAYNQEQEDPPSALCPYEPGAAAPLQYNLKQRPEVDQLQQLDGTKNDPNNPNPYPQPDSEKRKWWERLLTPFQDLIRPGREEPNDNRKAPYLSSAICPDPKKQVAVCSAESPYLPGPGELVIEYCRFRAFLFHFSISSLSTSFNRYLFFFFFEFVCKYITYTTSILGEKKKKRPCSDLTIGNGAL